MRYGLLFAIVASMIVAAGLVGVAVFAGGLALDFDVFWRAARAPIAHGYRPDHWQPFVYPPTAIPWLKPLAFLPFWPAFALWTILSLVSFFAAARSKAWWLMLMSPAFIECVAFGQTSLLVGAVLLLACSRRGWQMGALLVLALCLKPQVLVMAPLILLVRRDWPAIAGAVAGGLALLLFTTALYGPAIWLAWLHALPGFARVVDGRNLYWALITPYGLAAWAGVPPAPVWIAGALLSLVVVLRSARDWDDLAMPIAVTSILAVPYAVPHDLVAALPWCTGILLRRERDWRQAPAALIFSATIVPVGLTLLAVGWCRLEWPLRRRAAPARQEQGCSLAAHRPITRARAIAASSL
jgi:hypothetical protein